MKTTNDEMMMDDAFDAVLVDVLAHDEDLGDMPDLYCTAKPTGALESLLEG